MTDLLAYTVVLGNKPGKRIGIVKHGEMGYYPCERYDYAPDSIEVVKARVRKLNERMGVPEDVAESMTFASLFGWNVPAAARANEYARNN